MVIITGSPENSLYYSNKQTTTTTTTTPFACMEFKLCSSVCTWRPEVSEGQVNGQVTQLPNLPGK